MPGRHTQLAMSENLPDISGSLVIDSEEPRKKTRNLSRNKALESEDVGKLSLEDETDLLGNDDSGDDDEHFIATKQVALNRKASNIKGRSVKKGGGFQAMGLSSNLLKAISRKGFNVPTPIQRKTVPPILEGHDVVGMARTGSGKTAAFVIPMIEKLKSHNSRFGARALILSSSRELALQTLKVVKEFSRGTDLRCAVLVGGDSLEDQFGLVASNPDILIATPGRFLHLQVEMSLDLSSVKYVVFDEADRLFEMGFAVQLSEILHSLPASRQTLLFSATLPSSLVEFAKAGLQDPKLIRLDADSKISADLESAFFTIHSAEKEGALLHILADIIKVPVGSTSSSTEPTEQSRKRKRGGASSSSAGPTSPDSPAEKSTIIFVATKHHVNYIATLLQNSEFAVSYAYGALDQVARRNQVQDFRSGKTNILVVTDVAARGIDIPILANVINYDFPFQPKLFVHRVGRTARAGRRGWSYSLVCDSDAPYFLDLQLFLGKPIYTDRVPSDASLFSEQMVVGAFITEQLAASIEWAAKIVKDDYDLQNLRLVSQNAEKQYNKTRGSASMQSVVRSKEMTTADGWKTSNALFFSEDTQHTMEKEDMLSRVSRFRPQATIFEIGRQGVSTALVDVVKRTRSRLDSKRAAKPEANQSESRSGNSKAANTTNSYAIPHGSESDVEEGNVPPKFSNEDDEIENEGDITISNNNKHEGASTWEDSEHFMSYIPSSINMQDESGYGVNSGSRGDQAPGNSFVQAARTATMDLNMDQSEKAFGEPTRARGVRWDKKSKKYVKRTNDADGSKSASMIRGESGQKIHSSFKSGRFDAWKKSNRLGKLPRNGESEPAFDLPKTQGKSYKHRSEKAPKEADRYRDDFHKQKKRIKEAKDNRVGKWKEGTGVNELKSASAIYKQRKIKAKRMEKNARPSKRNKK